MSLEEALQGLSADCPKEISDRQRLIIVKYYSFDRKVHQGQLVIDVDLVEDIKFAFQAALKAKFLIYSVIPINQFSRDEKWDDDASMEANNSSCFNYRKIVGRSSLSKHALGRAVDINPMQNPYIKDGITLPAGSKYEPKIEGTLTETSDFVKVLLSRGWVWGGSWQTLKDYQHLEKEK